MWPSVVGVSRPCLSAPARSSLRGEAPAHAPGLARGVRGMWGVLRGNRDPRRRAGGARRQHNLTKISALNLKSDSDTLTSGPDRRRRVRSDRLNRAANRQALNPLIRHISERASDFTITCALRRYLRHPGSRETREACAASVVDQKILCVLDSQNASGKSQKPRLDQSSPGSGRRPARDRRPSE
jgi:hypothetical protein